MKRRSWIAVVEHHPGERYPRIRLIIPRGMPQPHNQAELNEFFLEAIKGLNNDLRHAEIIWQEPERKHSRREIRNAIKKERPSEEDYPEIE